MPLKHYRLIYNYDSINLNHGNILISYDNNIVKEKYYEPSCEIIYNPDSIYLNRGCILFCYDDGNLHNDLVEEKYPNRFDWAHCRLRYFNVSNELIKKMLIELYETGYFFGSEHDEHKLDEEGLNFTPRIWEITHIGCYDIGCCEPTEHKSYIIGYSK